MKILVILAHPDKNSFNHAIAFSARDALQQNGHNVIFHDLMRRVSILFFYTGRTRDIGIW